MLARISLMLFVIAGLCAGAFTLGTKATPVQGEAVGIPQEHPIALALRFHQELGLSPEQVAKLDGMRAALAKEFAPLREQAESIQHRMQELQQGGKADDEAVKKIKRESDELSAKMQPLFERYGQAVAELLSPEQKDKLGKLAGAQAHESPGQGFVLMLVMESRDRLGISPQQFTKLQYLQADFIRAFAPLREEMELLQMEVQAKYGGAGKEPPPEDQKRAGDIQKKIMELQSKFSERAVSDVLEPSQRAQLGDLIHGQPHPAPNGG